VNTGFYSLGFYMKILVADKISPTGVEYLRNQDGLEVIEAYGSSPEEIQKLAVDVSAIIVRSETKITPEVFAVAKELKVVGRAGVGVDNIDIESATENGVIVMNTPTGNTIATAELTFTHMLCGARPIPQASASMKAGKWARKDFSGSELRNKTLAVIGLGRIGAEVAKRAKAFDMSVIAYDPFLTSSRAKALDIKVVELEDAFKHADYITVHMPLTDTTKYMIDENAFDLMKDGVRLFNCARGGIIKETALINAVKSGKVAAAGLDVYESEPLSEDHELRSLDNIVLTPHLGASTKEAQESVGIEIAEAVFDVISTGKVINAINAPSVDAKTLQELQPYLTLGEKLGTFIQQLSPNQIVSLKITYWGKITNLDSLPLTRAIQKGYLLNISGQNTNDINAPLKMKHLGIEVEVTKSSIDCDYTDLIQIEAVLNTGNSVTLSGTILGKGLPKVVNIKGRDIEVNPNGQLILLENIDTPGIIGSVGQILGEHGVNIGNMTLCRSEESGGTALSVYELDSQPCAESMDKIHALDNIKNVTMVRL
jgi:D-3-phosphoglycerate dehydrogenase